MTAVKDAMKGPNGGPAEHGGKERTAAGEGGAGPARRARTRTTLIPQGAGIMVLKRILERSSSLLAAAALAFVIGFAAAWIAMGNEINDIRAELRGELDAVRKEQIADLDRRVALIERQLGLDPVLLPPSAPGADAEDRPPLPPRPPPGR